jgi:hypothetical protein
MVLILLDARKRTDKEQLLNRIRLWLKVWSIYPMKAEYKFQGLSYKVNCNY